MRRIWRFASHRRWYLFLGGCLVLVTIGDTYDLVRFGFHPDEYWPYWYPMVFLVLLIGYWKRHQILAFLRKEFRPAALDDRSDVD